MVTKEQLVVIMPRMKNHPKLDEYYEYLTAGMVEFAIVGPMREAAYLAQIAHESGEFKWMNEIWGPTKVQLTYEGRKGLGNTQKGDGSKYRGRGPIQITGRYMYYVAGTALGLDLINNPELAADPKVGFRTAAWVFAVEKGLNDEADKGWFKSITRAINGGFNGLTDRLKYYARAKKVLGV